MQIGLGLSVTGVLSQGVVDIVGPIITALPSVDLDAATVGVTLTGSEGAAIARGGGTVTFVEEWLVAGAQDATTATYTPDAGSIGDALAYRVTWTETGGTADGTAVRSVYLGPIMSAAQIISITGGEERIAVEYAGTLSVTGGEEQMILEVA